MRQKGGRSKREKKHRVTQSLKHKHNESRLETLADDDLARLLEGSNALILPAKGAQGAAAADGAGGEAAAAGAEEPPAEKQLSKSQLRKLRKIQEEKEKRAKRADVLQTLAQHQLKQEELQLLRPVAQRGQRETKKQALKRALQLQRAGVSLPSDVRLLQERDRPAAAMGEDESSGSSSESEEEEEKEEQQQQRQQQGGARMQSSSSGSESEEEGAAPASKRQRTAGTQQQGAQLAQPAPKQPAKAAAAAGMPPAQQAEQQAAAAAAEGKRQAAALRQAAEAAKAQLGVSEQRDEEFPAQQAQRAGQGMPAGPGGQPRVVMVQRRPDIQEVREGLPITGQEQEIMEAVLSHDVVVLCGETGCGKTTQVPQFLYEAGFGCRLFPERAGAVGVTQPRRVAAISTAERVADELDSKLGAVVGYQVRYDKRVGENTAIKFMTDGILLREVQEDFLLRRYSAILVDEAHERSLNTDILCGMLSRIVALRRSLADSAGGSSSGGEGEDKVYPLKLIIMSATLRTDDFVQNKRLFPEPPPVVCVPARQYPVTVHFSKRTELHDYVGAAFKKVSQIHRTLPPGGVLVFLTGQREVENLCRKLRATFNRPQRRKAAPGAAAGAAAANGLGGSGAAAAAAGAGPTAAADDVADAAAAAAAEEAAGVDAFSGDAAEVDAADGGEDAALLDALLEDDRMGGEGAHDDFDDDSSGDEEEVVVMGGEGFTPEQIKEAEADFERRLGISLTALKGGGSSGGDEQERAVGPVHVLPLYAMLPPAQQARVFRPPPPGHRLIVVATNVAETSLTIPGIRYVVDAGRSKQRLLETAAGLSRFEVRWVSKASAEQRAGRAGRTGPGHCYRLFSSAHFNDTFPQHTPPEILNTALEGVVLQMKALGVDKVANFPFPTPPEREALQAAERCLVALSALDGGSGQLTALGRAMAAYPISPRHARMLMEVSLQEQQAQQAGATCAAGASAAGVASAAVASAAAAAGGSSRQQRRVLLYAVALAAVLSVDSPFVHVDSISAGGDGSEGGTKAAADAVAAKAAADEQGGEGEDDGEEGQAGAARKAEKAAEKEAAKRKRQAARQAHAQFRVADSDALSALRALCAFEAAGEDEAFCRRNFLHFRNLREAAALHKQLARQLEAQGARQRGSSAAAPALALATGSAAGPLPPPAPAVMEQLRRALAAGWADQVARRIRSIDYLRAQEQQDKKSRAVRYSAAAGLDEDVFLHPNSTLHSTAPEFVVYAELIRTAKRPYMAGVTAIEPQWLPDVAPPLCTFSQPLAEPAPFYKPAADKVLCWRDVTFGRHDWALPRCTASHPDAAERCAVFAAALLEGRVLPSFAGLRAGLAVPLSMLLRPEMRVHKRASDLLAALTAARVDCRSALAAKWAQSPGFLRHELSQCMQKGCAGALLQAWEALRAEAEAPQPAADAAAAKKKKKKLRQKA